MSFGNQRYQDYLHSSQMAEPTLIHLSILNKQISRQHTKKSNLPIFETTCFLRMNIHEFHQLPEVFIIPTCYILFFFHMLYTCRLKYILTALKYVRLFANTHLKLITEYIFTA